MALFKTCPNCNRRNSATNERCDFCDTSLELTEAFEAPSLLVPRLTINHQVLFVPRQTELVIGRADRASGWTPDIDLTPHGGTGASGVSRRHAKLLWDGEWFIQDLNSANGTLVNQHAVPAGQSVALSNGAIIQIGNLFLVFHV